MLLNRESILPLEKFASRGILCPALNGVHITKEYIEATNNHCLLRITLPTLKAIQPDSDFPVCKDIYAGGNEIAEYKSDSGFNDVIIPIKDIIGMSKVTKKKSTLPILENISIRFGKDSVQVASTNLDSWAVKTIKTIEGPYPNTNPVIPGTNIQNHQKDGAFTASDSTEKMTVDEYIAMSQKKVADLLDGAVRNLIETIVNGLVVRLRKQQAELNEIKTRQPMFRICVNPAYLKNVAHSMTAFGAEEVVLSFYGATSAIRFDAINEKDQRAYGVLMPRRLEYPEMYELTHHGKDVKEGAGNATPADGMATDAGKTVGGTIHC